MTISEMLQFFLCTYGGDMAAGGRPILKNLVLLLHSPECNIKAAIDCSS